MQVLRFLDHLNQTEEVVRMIKEFREFVARGNVLDLAVAVVMGGAFGAIVTSLVNDLLMPPIGLLLGGVNFADLFLDLSREGYTSLAVAQEAGAATLNYGVFFNTVVNFLIVAWAMFMVIKGVNQLKRRQAVEEGVAEPTTKECPFCYSSIHIKATRCPNCTSEL
jgi:large conductance mechanosensitive channel